MWQWFLLFGCLSISRDVAFLPNTTPLFAFAIWLSWRIPSKQALLISLSALLLSDFYVAWQQQIALFGSWSIWTYSGLVGMILVSIQGYEFKRRTFSSIEQSRNTQALKLNITYILLNLFALIFIISASVLCHWLWTNFGVWVENKLYTLSMQGFIDCYIYALPFLKNSIVATLIWVGVLLVIEQLQKNLMYFRARLFQ